MNTSRKIGPVRVRPHTRGGAQTGKWFVDVPASLTSTGKRARRLFDNRKDAIEIATRLSRELERRMLNLSSVRRSGLGFSEAATRWAADEEARVRTLKKRRVSLDTDIARLKAAKAFFGTDDLSTITDRRLTDYQAARLAQGRSPDTVNSDVKSVMKVLKWAFKGKLLQELPAVEAIPSEPRSFEPPTVEELVRFIQAFPKRLRTLVWFLAETGCRSGEAFNLTWDDVDLDAGVINIRSKEGWTPKTKQSARRIYIGGPLLDALRKLPRSGQYVFQRRSRRFTHPARAAGHRRADWPITNIRKAFATAAKTAGLASGGSTARFTPHSLRKAYATRLALSGVAQRLLQANLGHSPGSRVTDQYYVFASEAARRSTVMPLPVAAGGNIRQQSSEPITAEADSTR